ncbi:hypothetical protein P3L10_024590 [Capsicum annuum]
MSSKRKETESGESGSTFDHQTKKTRVQIDSEKLPEQSQSGQNKAEESDNSSSPMGREIISKFQHDSIKAISIDKFRVAMQMNSPKAVFGDLVLKCQLEKPFDELRSIIKKENIDELFKKSCFAHFLELSGMRGMKEVRRRAKKRWRSNKRKVKKYGLLGIIGSSYKVEDLIVDLKNKDIPKHYREKLCLVWFVHSVLLERDFRKVIELDLLSLADDFGKFNDHLWGYDSYYLTVKYSLKELKLKTTLLYGFPWAFMAWTCEAILPLRKHFKDYPDKVSHSRILRWLAAVESNKKNINVTNLFNPPDDAVVHPWIMPTIDELGMTSFLTLGLVDTKEDPMVELIKKELDGATSMRRAVRQGHPNVEALHDQPQTAADPGASSGGIAGGVVCDVCKNREDKLLKKLEAIAEAVEKLKSRRGIIPSSEVREPCTPTVEVRRKRRKIIQIFSVLKSTKIATPPSPIVVEVQGPPKKVDIFAALRKEKKKKLEEFIKMKVQKEYTMHSFAAKDFSNMTNICVWYEHKYVDEILCLMKGRQLAFPDAYDAVDRIMDLNFYNNFKDR